MRYYVLCFSQEPGIAPFVVGELVRERNDPEVDREDTLAGALAGPRAMILTREELSTDLDGCRALAAWDRHDDTGFDRETIALLREGDVVWPDLELVTDG